MTQPTRIAKLVVLKGADHFITNKIDIHALNDDDLHILYEIANKQQRGFSIGVDEYKNINRIRYEQQVTNKKPIGEWNGKKPEEKRFIPLAKKKPIGNPVGKWYK